MLFIWVIMREQHADKAREASARLDVDVTTQTNTIKEDFPVFFLSLLFVFTHTLFLLAQ